MSNADYPLLIYCYDAWCGWCYGFSKVITQIADEYGELLSFEVLSGGMIFEENPRHISAIASYIQEGYKRVEALSGVQFGQDFLWHIFNADKSDWFPESTTPAVALCIFKEYQPEQAVQIAADFQYALNYEGRDLTDGEAYRHLLQKYKIPEEEFYQKLKTEDYKQNAYYEFALVKQLQITGFPAVLLQVSETKFYLLASGYTSYGTLKERLEKVLAEIKEKDGQQ
ncbi:MAG: DsbA family protein [Bacteroidota bacterium]